MQRQTYGQASCTEYGDERCRLDTERTDGRNNDEHEQYHSHEIRDEGLQCFVDILSLHHLIQTTHQQADNHATKIENDDRGHQVDTKFDASGLDHFDDFVPVKTQVWDVQSFHYVSLKYFF